MNETWHKVEQEIKNNTKNGTTNRSGKDIEILRSRHPIAATVNQNVQTGLKWISNLLYKSILMNLIHIK